MQELVEARDTAKLDDLIKAHEADFDLTMFQLLTSALSAAAADGQREEFEQIELIRDRALELTALGQKVKRQQAALDAFIANPTRETLLDQLVAADDAEMREA